LDRFFNGNGSLCELFFYFGWYLFVSEDNPTYKLHSECNLDNTPFFLLFLQYGRYSGGLTTDFPHLPAIWALFRGINDWFSPSACNIGVNPPTLYQKKTISLSLTFGHIREICYTFSTFSKYFFVRYFD
jgi:hypothetical protein